MRFREPANRRHREIIHVSPIGFSDPGEDIVAMIIDGSERRAKIADGRQRERRARRRPQTLVREYRDIRRMVDGNELKAIDKQNFLEFIGDPKLVTPVPRTQQIWRNAHVFIGIRIGPGRRREPGAHFPTAHEVGHELESRASPRVEERARRRFAVELRQGSSQEPGIARCGTTWSGEARLALKGS
jgi:hypothetical protein